MGAASSIECAQFDPEKFKQSKAIMESQADDAEKFSKLKEIWVTSEAAAAVVAAVASQAAGETSGAGDAHKKSTKDLHAAAPAHTDDKHDHAPDQKASEHHSEEPNKEDEGHKPVVGHDVKKDGAAHDHHEVPTDKKDDLAKPAGTVADKPEEPKNHGEAAHSDDQKGGQHAKSNDGARAEISDHHADKPAH